MSNNNGSIKLRPWLSVDDPRVTLIEQPVDRPCHYRYELARRSDATYFLAVDDDLFLTPRQMELLCTRLKECPQVPHGMFGQQYDSWTGVMHMAIRREAPMQILNRVYAFTAEHVRAFHCLVDAMGFHPWHDAWRGKPPWDDLLMSFSGTGVPLTHDVGPFLDCPLQDAPGIASFREEGFFPRRFDLFCSLRKIKIFGM